MERTHGTTTGSAQDGATGMGGTSTRRALAAGLVRKAVGAVPALGLMLGAAGALTEPQDAAAHHGPTIAVRGTVTDGNSGNGIGYSTVHLWKWTGYEWKLLATKTTDQYGRYAFWTSSGHIYNIQSYKQIGTTCATGIYDYAGTSGDFLLSRNYNPFWINTPTFFHHQVC